MSQNSTLQRGLNTRHIRFLALGSAIELGFSMVRQLLLKWQAFSITCVHRCRDCNLYCDARTG